ncbi:hypothetical protein GV828_01175 [Flavobacterium sp. NST-5]|uniref:Uncharacterized protein n=1 Tax=Flavobacterium ichthyis TaxID=2698827 RepID=A0ABW9Z4P2_9FLAO|nr:hypothetical protein [Flavobacterium ichthyis]NBL63805.1 hypothetical protein [Flavobacterium ichthyis]
MNFKKASCFILAFFLLLSSSGMAFSLHFCEGKLASVSTSYKAEEPCVKPEKKSNDKCCGTPKDNHKSCCSDKKVELKKKSVEIVTKTFSVDLDHATIDNTWKPDLFFFKLASGNNAIIDYYCDANAPPLFKLYSQYLLYA